MNRVVILIAMLFVSPFFMAQSCNKSCKNAICTDVFSMVVVQVLDGQNQPITLDEAYTIRKRNGEKISVSQDMTEGRYVVLDDSYKNRLENSKDDFRFVGLKDGKIIVDETFQISADCCHINKVSGKETVVVP